MKEYKYDIDNLIVTFYEHEEEYKKWQKKHFEEYPDSLNKKNDFSICMALISICEEIKELKLYIEELDEIICTIRNSKP